MTRQHTPATLDMGLHLPTRGTRHPPYGSERVNALGPAVWVEKRLSFLRRYEVSTTAGSSIPRGLSPKVGAGTSTGLDHGIGHIRLVEVDSAARAPAPPTPISPRTSSAACG